MKKIYEAPSAELTCFDTEKILEISFTGAGNEPLVDKKPDAPDKEFGNITLF